MGGSSKRKYYAVAVGRSTGIFDTWAQCEAQVSGFPHARFKSFAAETEARQFIDENKGLVNKRVVLLPSNVENSSMADACVPAACTHSSQVDLSPLPLTTTTRPHPAKRSREEDHHDTNTNNNNNKNNNNSGGALELRDDHHHISMGWMRAREEEAVEVYVDGACRSNGKSEPGRARGGYGGYYVPNSTERIRNIDPNIILSDFSLPLPDGEAQTNNRAELHAVIHVLQTALQARRCYNLRVYSDSTYVIRGADIYMPLWLKRGFVTATGAPVLNSDLWHRLQTLRTQHEERYATRLRMEFGLAHTIAISTARQLALRLVHVRGHTGVHGNVMADRLAVNGALRGMRR
ncbi:Ribonuclease H domain [Trypanosoma melophagium]|uniref:Ribonuclease H domain n=1 Tax=Trypanosoma melophagium TaxID=715481 RepID=UPI00351A2E2C|nr:Ribonuclease H domain [Trypanosoma melophagium]